MYAAIGVSRTFCLDRRRLCGGIGLSGVPNSSSNFLSSRADRTASISVPVSVEAHSAIVKIQTMYLMESLDNLIWFTVENPVVFTSLASRSGHGTASFHQRLVHLPDRIEDAETSVLGRVAMIHYQVARMMH
jgi:hypothetical protein